MNIDDLIASTGVPQTADEMLTVFQAVMEADDLSDDERAAFAMGFTVGCSYALAKYTEGDIRPAAQTLLRLQNEWDAHGVFG